MYNRFQASLHIQVRWEGRLEIKQRKVDEIRVKGMEKCKYGTEQDTEVFYAHLTMKKYGIMFEAVRK